MCRKSQYVVDCGSMDDWPAQKEMLSSCKSQQLFQLCERMLWISLALFELIYSNKIQSLCSCNLCIWPTPTFHKRISNEDGIIFPVVSTLKDDVFQNRCKSVVWNYCFFLIYLNLLKNQNGWVFVPSFPGMLIWLGGLWSVCYMSAIPWGQRHCFHRAIADTRGLSPNLKFETYVFSLHF